MRIAMEFKRNVQGDRPVFFYKEIIRVVIGQNKHLVASLRSDNKISIMQSINTPTDEMIFDLPVAHAISIFRASVIKILYLFMYIAIRLPENEIPKEDKDFIAKLREISLRQQAKIIYDAKELGYHPVQFSGESYDAFRQNETGRGVR